MFSLPCGRGGARIPKCGWFPPDASLRERLSSGCHNLHLFRGKRHLKTTATTREQEQVVLMEPPPPNRRVIGAPHRGGAPETMEQSLVSEALQQVRPCKCPPTEPPFNMSVCFILDQETGESLRLEGERGGGD